MSVKSKLTNLANSIRSKANISKKLTIDEMTEAVNAIVIAENNKVDERTLTVTPSKETQSFTSSDLGENTYYGTVTVDPIPSEYITTSDATATEDDILVDKIAYANGQKLVGTYFDVNEEDVKAGVYFGPGQRFLDGSMLPDYMCKKRGTFTADATAEEGDILEGKIAYANGWPVIGTMPSKQAETYTPGTADITIPAGTYLSGEQIIKGDANLKVENIKSGVTIFNVTGGFTSDADATAGDIAQGKTAYVKGEKVIGTAVAGGGGSSGTILYMPMNGNLDIYGELKTTSCICEQYNEMDMVAGDWTPTFSDDGVFEGEKCFSLEKAVVSEDDWYPPSFCKVWLPTNDNCMKDDFTIDVWIHKLPYVEGETRSAVIYIATNTYINLTTSYDGETSVSFYSNLFSYFKIFSVAINDTWNHIAFVRKSNSIYCFLNGVLLRKDDIIAFKNPIYGPYKSSRGGIGSLTEETEIKTAHLRILNHALWTENFTPPTKESYAAYMM
jgi:hypothetical protein